MRKSLPVLLLCAVAVAQEPPTTRPNDAAAVEGSAAKADAPLLTDLATKMATAYAELDSLYVESQIYEGVRMHEEARKGDSSRPELTFDDKIPLIATVKSWNRPAHEVRSEAYVNGKQVWAMVSHPMKDGKSTVVEWNDEQITKPYSAGDIDEGRSCHLKKDRVPGHCIIGWYLLSFVGGKEGSTKTFPNRWKDYIREGQYKGRVKNMQGDECYCISYAGGNGGLVTYYLDATTFLVTQIDNVQLIFTLDDKVAGVGSQRWTFKNLPQAIDAEKFNFPAPDERKVIVVKE